MTPRGGGGSVVVSDLGRERFQVDVTHPHSVRRPDFETYKRMVQDKVPEGSESSIDWRGAYDSLPEHTGMEIKFPRALPERLVVVRVQTAFMARRQGHAVRMLCAAIEQCGRPVSEVAIEGPNSNSMAWWEGTVAPTLSEAFPNVRVLPIPDPERQAIHRHVVPLERIT